MLNLDHLIIEFDKGLRTIFGSARSMRPHPDVHISNAAIAEDEKKISIALMRVNHSGEVSAQALYQGQALTARDAVVQKKLQHAAQEENDHLAWTAQRLYELGGHGSIFKPLWYGGSLAIGALAGLLGDKWNLGFLAETERQVGAHLQGHLQKLPEQDTKSRAVVAQMIIDETSHANMAQKLGGIDLPLPLKLVMQASAKVMTRSSYWV